MISGNIVSEKVEQGIQTFKKSIDLKIRWI